MKSVRFGLTILAILVLFSGCASMRVVINYDETADFSQYKTYYPVKPQLKAGPGAKRQQVLFDKQVLGEIQQIMEAKGFQIAGSPKEADLLMHFYSMIKNERDYVPPTYRVGRWGRRWVAQPGHVVHTKEGTLGIDMVDRFRKELVWQGIGKGVLDKANPRKNLVESVAEVLKDFPPKN
ncbi:DUF4136 domain-containing protein [candidate division KSB1 bacterium]|nr:DUF4136 domain-containing protein [candidate division KSB1 bacterium]